MPGRLLGLGRANPTSGPDQPPAPLAASDRESGREPKDSFNHQIHLPAAMDHIKRPSIPGISTLKHHAHQKYDKEKEKGKRRGSPGPPAKPARPSNKITMTVESPPNIFYGSPDTSSGVLFSGRLTVHVTTTPEIVLDTFSMELVAKVTAKKPIVRDCPDCISKQTHLHRWKFLNEPKTLPAGSHEFPFSHLVPGHLPTTTHGALGILEYSLHAKATTRHGEELTLTRPLELSRAVPPVPEKTSQRVFPPMDLTVHASFSPILYPIGRTSVLLRLSNVTEKPEDRVKRPEFATMDNCHRWRLRKMTWRLEETERMISPACARHANKVGGEGKGIAHEDTRCLARDDLRDGWKSDFAAGEIDLEFAVQTPAPAAPRPQCDNDSPTGLRVSHALVVELVIAEEWARCKQPDVATPTGAARVLRATFGVVVTERAGLGISWDEEQPPVYEDVPASPPQYGIDGKRGPAGAVPASAAGMLPGSARLGRGEFADYTGPPLDDMEGLSLGEANRPVEGYGAGSARVGR